MLFGLVLVAVAVFAVVFAPSGRTPGLPDAVESYAPVDGAGVPRQTQIVVDLEAGYRVELTVDGIPIPAVEIGGDDISGRYTWEPGPGKAIEEWIAGLPPRGRHLGPHCGHARARLAAVVVPGAMSG